MERIIYQRSIRAFNNHLSPSPLYLLRASRTLITRRSFSMSSKTQEPKIVKISELSTEEAKWVEFKKIEVRSEKAVLDRTADIS